MEAGIAKAGKTGRIWELDFLRGIALVCMIYFHIIYDLNSFLGIPVSYTSGINYFIGKISAILFMLLSGLSSRLSRNILRHGIHVFSIALGLTAVTELVDFLTPILLHQPSPGVGIKFGILHLLGICMLLFPLLKKIKTGLLFILSTVIILLGMYLEQVTVTVGYLFPFGLMNTAFYSSDYYPLFPWSGIFIVGIALSGFLYPEKKSLFSFSIPENPLSSAGRHTLIVYVLHQPVILGILGISTYFIK